jgi:hypothetical protein
MNLTLSRLLNTIAAPSFDKQLHLSQLVGEEDWHFNMASGLLSFGQHLHFQAQLLGTESDHDRTWLWAWANEGSHIPPPLLQAALQMKTLGEEQQIPEFTTPGAMPTALRGHGSRWPFSFVLPLSVFRSRPVQCVRARAVRFGQSVWRTG